MKSYLKLAAVVALLFTLVSIPVHNARAEDRYKFKVHNTTKDKITKLLVSEDGKKYGFFDVGKGIAPGETMTLVWDAETSGCEWFIKAVFSDGAESPATKFDFCQEDLELDF
jgi:hypothetical protein